MEKITIEIAEYGFKVSQGDKIAEVGWDEMLGLVASLTMPEKRPCLQWMETEEQRTAKRAQWVKPHDIESSKVINQADILIEAYTKIPNE